MTSALVVLNERLLAACLSQLSIINPAVPSQPTLASRWQGMKGKLENSCGSTTTTQPATTSPPPRAVLGL